MAATLLQTILTAAFQPSQAALIVGGQVVLDFELVVPAGPAISVQWYPEYTEDNPKDPNAKWFRECAEEDIGNGNVRMPLAIRRFSTNGADAALPAGTYRIDCQFKRTHKIYRVQILGLGCLVTVSTPFGEIPVAP